MSRNALGQVHSHLAQFAMYALQSGVGVFVLPIGRLPNSEATAETYQNLRREMRERPCFIRAPTFAFTDLACCDFRLLVDVVLRAMGRCSVA